MTTHMIPGALRRFALGEAGAITVDWAVLTAAMTGMAMSAAALLVTSSDAFQLHVSDDLTRDVSGVVPTSARTDDQVSSAQAESADGADGSSADGELRFAGVSPVHSTTISRVDCSTSAPGCGASSSTVTRRYLMSDGSVWTRTTVTAEGGGESKDQWFDGDGRETSDVPEMPEDVEEVHIR